MLKTQYAWIIILFLVCFGMSYWTHLETKDVAEGLEECREDQGRLSDLMLLQDSQMNQLMKVYSRLHKVAKTYEGLHHNLKIPNSKKRYRKGLGEK